MAVKMSGLEFKKFWSDESVWPGKDGDTYVDDEEITVGDVVHTDGVDSDDVNDADVVVISGGVVLSEDEKFNGISLETHYRRWKKKQNLVVMIIECSKDNADAVKQAIKSAGASVVV